VVKVGDDVEVEVLRIEPAHPASPDKAKHKERITLSMRSRQEDPWKVGVAELQEGQQVSGKVVRLQPFGAFVELKPGVDGLIHISALSNRRIAHPRDVVAVGDEVKVVVERVDPVEKRIGLRRVLEDGMAAGGTGAPAAVAPAEESKGAASTHAPATPAAPRPRVGQVVTGTVDRIESFGLFLTFPGGRGLVPASETGTERGTDLRRIFKLGQELKVAIVEIEGGGKIRLSIPGAARAEERADLEAWKKSQQASSAKGKGFGTFGDLFKNKLGGGQSS
jgi:small subunit ribosomal protein S1